MVENGLSVTAHQPQGHIAYLDGLLAALNLLNLGLGQGDPLPKGLQLAPAQLYSLRDPVTEKITSLKLLLKPLQPPANLLSLTAKLKKNGDLTKGFKKNVICLSGSILELFS